MPCGEGTPAGSLTPSIARYTSKLGIMYISCPPTLPGVNTSAAGAGLGASSGGGVHSRTWSGPVTRTPRNFRATPYPAIDRHERSSSFQLRTVAGMFEFMYAGSSGTARTSFRSAIAWIAAQRMRYSRSLAKSSRYLYVDSPGLRPSERTSHRFSSIWSRPESTEAAPAQSAAVPWCAITDTATRRQLCDRLESSLSVAFSTFSCSVLSPASALDASCHHSSSTASVWRWSLSAMACARRPS